MSTPPDWSVIRATFEDLCECPAEERQLRLAALAAAQPDLARAVRKLLEADASDSLPAIEPPPIPRLDAPRWMHLDTGRSIAGFRILRFLAQGGMGAVYEAEQLEPHRTVALKILRPELCVSTSLRRFRLEAEVLARLEHVGIAKVYAAGLEEIDGGPFAFELPWYALEYLADAAPITTRAHALGLSLDERIDWAIAVGDAVHHAHQRGVIHRDLKPGNILVGRGGALKIVDFGIARALDHGAEAGITQAGMILGTPAYMSPEQRAGVLDLDLRTDIYALGKVLGELCAPVASIASVPEIDWIVAKATHDDRDERYTSAAEFVADLRAYRSGLPVAAAPPSPTYRLRKLLIRHRRKALAAVAFVSILAASLVVSLFALERARRSETVAHQHAENAIRAAAVLTEEKATVAGVVEVLRSTVTRAIGKRRGDDASIAEFCRELETEIAREDLPLRTRALTANYLATVRFANGDWPASEVLCRRALELMAQAGLESTPEGILAHGASSEVLRNLGRHDEAEVILAKGLELAEAHLAPLDPTLLSMLRRRVLLDLEMRRYERARALAADVLQRRREAFGEDADETRESTIDLAQCALAAGSDEGVALARTTLERLLDGQRPENESMLALRLNLGVVLARKADWPAAIEELRRARESAQALLAPDHPRVAAIESNLGAIQLASGDPQAAVPNLRAAADHFGTRLPELHPQRLSNLASLARALRLAGQPIDAATCLGTTVDAVARLGELPAASLDAAINVRLEAGLAAIACGSVDVGRDAHRELLAQCTTISMRGQTLATGLRQRLTREYAAMGLADLAR
ncbi:MAG: serine/threonine protein kinase [Planctomycetes bacterium]|nr:serine/threonine protein kinase [Planctomycetota bacterium]